MNLYLVDIILEEGVCRTGLFIGKNEKEVLDKVSAKISNIDYERTITCKIDIVENIDGYDIKLIKK